MEHVARVSVAVAGDVRCPFAHEAFRLVLAAGARGSLARVVAPAETGPAEAGLLAARAAGVDCAVVRGRDPLRLAEQADELWRFGEAKEWDLWFQGAGKVVRTLPVGEPGLLLLTAPHPRSKRARGYTGPSKLDVTRKSAGPEGLPFAPSKELLDEARRRFAEADLIEAEWGVDVPETAAHVEELRVAAWAWYEPRFQAEMRRSWVEDRPAWDALLARPLVVLVCYCPARERCHRGVLARLLVRAGERLGRRVVDGGEVRWMGGR